MISISEYHEHVYCTVLVMGRTSQRPHRLRSCWFTLVRDPSLKKIDSNTRRVHSQLPCIVFARYISNLSTADNCSIIQIHTNDCKENLK